MSTNMSSLFLDNPQQPNRPRQSFRREFLPLRGSYGNGQVQLHNLCVKCEELGKRMHDLLEYKGESSDDHFHEVFEHYTTASLLRESCRRGCHLCNIIWVSFTTDTRNRAPFPGFIGIERKYTTLDNNEIWTDKKSYCVMVAFGGTRGASPYIAADAFLRQPRPSSLSHDSNSSATHHQWVARHTSEKSFRVKPIEKHSFYQPVQPEASISTVSTRSAECRAFFKTCMEICDKTHRRCHRKRVGQLPTRMLHITEAPSGTGPSFLD